MAEASPAPRPHPPSGQSPFLPHSQVLRPPRAPSRDLRHRLVCAPGLQDCFPMELAGGRRSAGPDWPRS